VKKTTSKGVGWPSSLFTTLLFCPLAEILLAIHSHLYSFALRFLFLQNHATSYSFYNALLYTVKETGGKPERKPLLIPYGLRNPSKTSSLRTFKIMPRTLKKLYVHEFGFVTEKEKEEKRARGNLNLEMESCGLDTEFVPFAIRVKLVSMWLAACQ
jgi:hypothetical protein